LFLKYKKNVKKAAASALGHATPRHTFFFFFSKLLLFFFFKKKMRILAPDFPSFQKIMRERDGAFRIRRENSKRWRETKGLSGEKFLEAG
jgi:hypothetical protein